ncbi:hypothetical protein GQ44DRAFT_680985 [Phaeosphaeriaceae sp. PMI808]|nr:hypothetical protein GQ44DRAFT_680985 [Phaeosphaeriaceae sp. PMI808]
MESSRIKYRYAPFYHTAARYPEVPKFRRFGAQWAKKLYDDIEEVQAKEQTLNDALARVHTKGGATLSVLDCPRSLVKNNTEVHNMWIDYEDALRKYCEQLCLTFRLFELPDQAPYFHDYLNKYQRLFENGVFAPTGELAHLYQDPSAADFCAWRGMSQESIITNWYVRNGNWIQKTIVDRMRRFLNHRKSLPTRPRREIHLKSVNFGMDVLACIFVPLFLILLMFVLINLQSTVKRIALIGVFGTIFSVSMKIVVGRITRGEIFACTAAFFAVASVFVGTPLRN